MDFLSGLLAKFMVGKAVNFIAKEAENVAQPVDMPQNIEEYGFSQSLKNRGSATAYKMNIYHLYETFKSDLGRDEKRQEELRRPLKTRRDELDVALQHLREKADDLAGRAKNEIREKIAALNHEIAGIKNNPQTVVANPANRVLFIIVAVSLLFLTAFLVLFYSSTAYSAFFREFSPSQIGIVHAIFSPDTFQRAWNEGIMAVFFIAFAPIIFLALGLTIHLFIEHKKNKYIPLLFIFAFLFDSFLAYEISEKIYDLKALQSFLDIPLYSIGMAVQSINFWIIIFCGFMVYILWGILFHFCMDFYHKRDRVSEAVKARETQIGFLENRLSEIDSEIEELNETAYEYKKEIAGINRNLESPLIDTKVFEQLIYGFSAGWIECLHANKFNPKLETDVNEVLSDFMNNTLRKNHKENRHEKN